MCPERRNHRFDARLRLPGGASVTMLAIWNHRCRAVMLLGAGLFLLASLTIGCQPVIPDEPAPDPQATPGLSSDPGQSDILQAWQSGAHANTYVSDESGNNVCARCHSPRDWAPTSSADLPADCQTCKFTVPMPMPVSETDWKSIECDICHRVTDGVVDSRVVWLDAAAAEYSSSDNPYEMVGTNTELCEKCHRDTGIFFYKRDLGNGAHAGMQCTDCHGDHTLQADCATCHGNVLETDEPVPGHDAAHESVSCVGCHDASGLDVRPVEGRDIWLPHRTIEMPGKSGANPYLSHDLQREVACDRCHYANNPWGLGMINGSTVSTP